MIKPNILPIGPKIETIIVTIYFIEGKGTNEKLSEICKYPSVIVILMVIISLYNSSGGVTDKIPVS